MLDSFRGFCIVIETRLEAGQWVSPLLRPISMLHVQLRHLVVQHLQEVGLHTSPDPVCSVLFKNTGHVPGMCRAQSKGEK